MKKYFILSLFISITTLLSAQIKTVHNATAHKMTLVHTSLPLRTISPEKIDFSGKRIERENPFHEHKIKVQPNPDAKPVGDDPAWQKTTELETATTVNIIDSWEGASTNVDPSDNTLAVSANYVVQVTNNSSNSLMNVWDKSGTVVAANINTMDLTGMSDYGDPDIVYDQQADRFVLCLLKGFGSKLIIAISTTGDPAGTWNSYQFSTPDGFPDYPKIAVWGDSYLLTTNSNNPTLWAINRDALLTGAPIGTVQQFILDDFGTISFESASPITETGNIAPPASSPAMFIRVGDDAWAGEDTDHLEMYFVDVNWVDAGLSTITGPYNLNTIDYDSQLCGFDNWSCVPQPGTATKLDPLSDIVMDKVQYRVFPDHETIVCSHVCRADVAGHAGIRWYELRKTPAADWFIFQQGTFAPDDGNYRFMSSVTMNDFGTIALGYNISSSDVDPGIRLTGRTVCDPINMMGADEVTAQDGAHFNSYNRYGDYNAMITDPADGSFWFTGNYNPTSSWSTRVIHFSIDTCAATNAGEITHDTLTWPTTDINNVAFADLTIIPNPADDNINITFSSTTNDAMKIQLFDITGKMIVEKTIQSVIGINNYKLDISTIADGNYLVAISSEKGNAKKKLVVLH